MSGVVKGVKKVFKKVANVVKKVAKPLLVAAAVYFTAGLALSAFPATAAFASSLPGFAGGGFLGTGIGAGASAGTGIFTKVAAKFGLASLGKAGGLAGGALTKGTGMAALEGAIGTKAVAAGVAKGVASGATTAATAVTPSVGAALSSPANQAILAKGAATGAGGAAGGSMSLADKLLLASTGTNAISGLLAPSPREIQEARTRWVGAFYGDEGNGPQAPPPGPLIPPRPMGPAAAQPKPKIPSVAPQRSVPKDVQQMRQQASTQPQDTVDRQYQFGGDSLIPAATDPFEATQ